MKILCLFTAAASLVVLSACGAPFTASDFTPDGQAGVIEAGGSGSAAGALAIGLAQAGHAGVSSAGQAGALGVDEGGAGGAPAESGGAGGSSGSVAMAGGGSAGAAGSPPCKAHWWVSGELCSQNEIRLDVCDLPEAGCSPGKIYAFYCLGTKCATVQPGGADKWSATWTLGQICG